jgi:serine/threonine-protein kinase
MLTGAVPFSGEAYGEVLNQHLTCTPPPLAGVPEPLAAVVLRALEKRRDARFPSMAVFAQALADPAAYLAGALPAARPRPSVPLPLPAPVSVIAQHPTTLTQSAAELGVAPRPGGRGRVGVMLASCVAALALLGTAGFWALERAGGRPAASEAPRDPVPEVAAAAPAPPPPAPPPTVEPAPAPTISLSFTSEPPGADVLVDGKARGKTPLVLEVPRAEGELAVTFRLAGYKDKTRAVRASHEAALDVALERQPPTRRPPSKSVKPLDDDAVLQPNF